MDTLADRLNADRLARRMTWPVYAAWLDLRQSTVYKIATGATKQPHALTVAQIERKLREPIPEGVGSREVVSAR